MGKAFGRSSTWIKLGFQRYAIRGIFLIVILIKVIDKAGAFLHLANKLNVEYWDQFKDDEFERVSIKMIERNIRIDHIAVLENR